MTCSDNARRPLRHRRMFHDRDERGQNYLTCIVHGRQRAVSQDEAERVHAAGQRCPTCLREIEATGLRNRTAP